MVVIVGAHETEDNKALARRAARSALIVANLIEEDPTWWQNRSVGRMVNDHGDFCAYGEICRIANTGRPFAPMEVWTVRASRVVTCNDSGSQRECASACENYAHDLLKDYKTEL